MNSEMKSTIFYLKTPGFRSGLQIVDYSSIKHSFVKNTLISTPFHDLGNYDKSMYP